MRGINSVIRDRVEIGYVSLHTDESGIYKLVPWRFAAHETVKHSAYEYVRGDVTTNTVEGYFSIFKRGMKAFISIAAKSICTAISQNLTIAITIALRLAITILIALSQLSKVQAASG